VVSGAGPTVLVLANGEAEATAALDFIETFKASNTPDIAWRVLKLAVDVEGAKVDMHRR
jgi:homoserine kinase